MNTLKCWCTIFIVAHTSWLSAQEIKDFYYTEPETKTLPVFIRGNLSSQKILLFNQGGDADNGIDFGRSDYPNWKKTLETKVAVAYFDKRGLNTKPTKIDTTKINYKQISQDLIAIAASLKNKYNAEVYLFGHSLGGVEVLECLSNFPNKSSFIKGAIVFNAPITTDFSPLRYNYYRPLYLKNTAERFVQENQNVAFWQEAVNWMSSQDSISTPEASKKWNAYVDKAFEPTKRKIGIGMVMKVIFSRPYNPISYFNSKDNELVGDKLWYDKRQRWEAGNNISLWKSLSKIKQPTLLVTGRYDAIAVPEELEAAEKLIENASLIVIENASHQSFLDQPQIFNQSIINFLNSRH